MNHSETPVLDALVAYRRRRELPFTPPGHKSGRGADPRVREVLGEAVFRSDVPSVSGLDDRRSSYRVLRRAQELMADAVRAENAFFCTCGGSLAIGSAMLSVAGPGGKLLIGRDAHRSVVSGLVLGGIEPVWAEPQWDHDRHLAHPPSAEAYARLFAEHPDAHGALVTSPTPYGTCADLEAIADVCHRYGRPLIVDEAWGAHLPFHPDLPTWGMAAGADVCVTSVHKMGGGPSQGAVLHQQGGLVDPAALKSRADLLGTAHPSALVHAGLDGWRRQMVEHGRELLQHAIDLAAEVREEIVHILGVHAAGPELVGPGRAHDLDPLHLVLDLAELGVSGYRAADWLRETHRVAVHLADHRRISAPLTVADGKETADALLTALHDLSRHAPALRDVPPIYVPAPADLRLEQAVPPREAFFGPAEQVPADQAAGRVAAETLTPSPPGVPAVLPGERLTAPIIDYLRTGVAAGMLVPDATDPTLTTIRVHTTP